MGDIAMNLIKGDPGYGDWLLADGDIVLTSDIDSAGTNPILQNVLQRLRFMLGEFFMDTTQGFPWIQRVFVKGTREAEIDALVQDTILGTPGMLELSDYSASINRAARNLSLSFSGTGTSGKVEWTGTLTPTTGG